MKKKTHQVLVIEDNALERAMVSEVLRASGLKAAFAADAAEGLAAAKSATPDLVLLDLVLPDMDGLALCEEIRALPGFQLVPIIIVSGRTALADRLRGLTRGADDYIAKPIEPAELVARINAHLRLRDQGLELQEKNEVLEQANLMSETLLGLSLALSASPSFHTILRKTVAAVAAYVDAIRCSIVLVGDDSEIGHVIATFEDPSIHDLPIDLGKYPEIRKVVSTGQVVVVKDVATDPLMAPVRPVLSSLPIQSIMVLPLRIKTLSVGTLFLRTSRRKKGFSTAELAFCRTVANMTAQALERVSLVEELVRKGEELEGSNRQLKEALDTITRVNRSRGVALQKVHALLQPSLAHLNESVAAISRIGSTDELGKSLRRFSGLLENIRYLGDFLAAQTSFQVSPLRLREIFDAILWEIQGDLGERTVQVRNTIPPALPPVFADYAALCRALGFIIHRLATDCGAAALTLKGKSDGTRVVIRLETKGPVDLKLIIPSPQTRHDHLPKDLEGHIALLLLEAMDVSVAADNGAKKGALVFSFPVITPRVP